MSITARIITWIPIIFYSAVLFYLSSRPPLEVPVVRFPGMDKLLHVGAYLVWGVVCGWTVSKNFPEIVGLRFVLIVAVAGTLYGLSDEFHQSFVSERRALPAAGCSDRKIRPSLLLIPPPGKSSKARLHVVPASSGSANTPFV